MKQLDGGIGEGFAEANGVRIHYLRSGDSSKLTPLVYQPGLLSDAESFRSEMKRLAPRVVIGAGRRGVGQSSAPPTGYGLSEQVADLRAVVAHCFNHNAQHGSDHSGTQQFCLTAFSLGVPLALRFALQQPERLAGLILLDYPARYPQITSAWAEQAGAEDPGLAEHVPWQLHLEATENEFWAKLPALSCPVLIIAGGQPDALLKQTDLERYAAALPQATTTVFEDSGHELYKPDYERFMSTIETFLAQLDQGVAG